MPKNGGLVFDGPAEYVAALQRESERLRAIDRLRMDEYRQQRARNALRPELSPAFEQELKSRGPEIADAFNRWVPPTLERTELFIEANRG